MDKNKLKEKIFGAVNVESRYAYYSLNDKGDWECENPIKHSRKFQIRWFCVFWAIVIGATCGYFYFGGTWDGFTKFIGKNVVKKVIPASSTKKAVPANDKESVPAESAETTESLGNGDNPVADTPAESAKPAKSLGNGDTPVADTKSNQKVDSNPVPAKTAESHGNGDNLVAESKSNQKEEQKPVPEKKQKKPRKTYSGYDTEDSSGYSIR